MPDKIKIGSLVRGMYVEALFKGDLAPMEKFVNSIQIRDAGHAATLIKQGYTHAIIDEQLSHTLPHQEPEPPHIEEIEPTLPSPEKPTEPVPSEILAATSTPEGEPEAEPFPTRAPERPFEAKDTVSFEIELEQAQEAKSQVREIISTTLEDIRLGKNINSEPLEEAVDSVVDSAFRNQDAILSLARLKDHDNYTFGHSVNVCILSVALGMHANLPEEALRTLGLSAILHDAGKMLIDSQIINKPARLTKAEMAFVKKHTTFGADILDHSPGLKEVVIEVARGHHERYDGTGYPNHLPGSKIHPFCNIVSIADFYDAVTTDRPYRKGLHPTAALRSMYRLKGTKFEPELVDKFIHSIGIYPIGSFVLLNTGETARVITINRSNLLKPKVRIVMNKFGVKRTKPVDIELSTSTDHVIVSTEVMRNDIAGMN